MGREWKSEKLNMLSNVKLKTGPALWPCHCGNGRFAVDPGDRRRGASFFWGGGLSLATLHSRPAHAAGFSLGMHRASCDPRCENQIDVSHYRSQWYPFNGTGGEAAHLSQIGLFLRVLCSLQPAPFVPLYADSDIFHVQR